MFANAWYAAPGKYCYVAKKGDGTRVVLVAHACTKFVSLGPSVIWPRHGKAAELTEVVESDYQASAVSVKELRCEIYHQSFIVTLFCVLYYGIYEL